jgi:HNH endonuclease
MPKVSKRLRLIVYMRAVFSCEYCKSSQKYSPSPFNIEHIFPFSLGGKSNAKNLALSCNGCNGYKSDKTTGFDPINNQEVSLFHPRNDDWKEHFAWTNKYHIIGLTPTGRATVELLKLNRVELINLRSLLSLIGLHPPS